MKGSKNVLEWQACSVRPKKMTSDPRVNCCFASCHTILQSAKSHYKVSQPVHDSL